MRWADTVKQASYCSQVLMKVFPGWGSGVRQPDGMAFLELRPPSRWSDKFISWLFILINCLRQKICFIASCFKPIAALILSNQMRKVLKLPHGQCSRRIITGECKAHVSKRFQNINSNMEVITASLCCININTPNHYLEDFVNSLKISSVSSQTPSPPHVELYFPTCHKPGRHKTDSL